MRYNKLRSRARILLAVGSASSVVLLAAGCGSSGSDGGSLSSNPSAAGSSGVYQWGSTSDLTGPLAAVGSSLKAGWNAYVDYVNAHGGIHGHKIKLISLDDQSQPATGVANIKELIGDGVSAILVHSSQVAAAGLTTAENAHVVLDLNSGTDNLLYPPVQYIFQGWTVLDKGDSAAMFNFAKQKLAGVSHPRVGFLTLANPATEGLEQLLSQKAKAAGWQIVGNEVVPLTTSDDSEEATTVAGKNPDLIFNITVDGDTVPAMHALQAAGYNGPVVDYEGASAATTLTQADSPNLYVLRAGAYPSVTSPGLLGAISKTAAASGVNVPQSSFLLQGIVEAYVLGQAELKCGWPCSGKQLAAAFGSLGTVQTHGLTYGPMLFGPSSHAGMQYVGVMHLDPSTHQPAEVGSPVSVG